MIKIYALSINIQVRPSVNSVANIYHAIPYFHKRFSGCTQVILAALRKRTLNVVDASYLRL